MAQAYGACWVVQEDAMDGSLQAKSAMGATEPPRPDVMKRLFEESLRPGVCCHTTCG